MHWMDIARGQNHRDARETAELNSRRYGLDGTSVDQLSRHSVNPERWVD
jgi:hypothetical protein